MTFRDLYGSAQEVRAALPPGRVLGVFADRAPHRPLLAQLAYAARIIAGHVLVLIPVAGTSSDGLTPPALIRAVLAARDLLGAATLVAVPLVALPLAGQPDDIEDALLRGQVALEFGATHLLASGAQTYGGPHVLLPRELAYDGRDGQWRAADDIPPRHRRVALSDDEIATMLDLGVALPEWHTPAAVAQVLAQARPPRSRRGLVVLLAGPDGEHLARGAADALNETGERTVTVIEAPMARRLGDAVGFVAAEAARHGGLVLCADPGPEAAATLEPLAHAVGADFLAVGAGIDAPPARAGLTLATSRLAPDEAVQVFLSFLTKLGWLTGT